MNKLLTKMELFCFKSAHFSGKGANGFLFELLLWDLEASGFYVMPSLQPGVSGGA